MGRREGVEEREKKKGETKMSGRSERNREK